MPARFHIQAVDEDAVNGLIARFALPRFIAATLVARGLDDPEAVERFLSPELDRDWHDPYEIGGMRELVDGLAEAIRSQKSIIVFGDFDLDGISATAILTRALRILGAQADPFIPDRVDEGYGLTDKAIDRLQAEHRPDCLITVDCGIASRDEVARLRAEGVEVFITDHHEPGDAVPEGVPLVDPKQDEESPSKILAGVGVALKLIQALGGRFGQPHLWRAFLDLATLGTVADLMPMRGENRALVAEGLRIINEETRPCLQALIDVAGVGDDAVSSSNLSFTLIPRLNAAGRMGTPMLAFDLLMDDSLDSAYEKARKLEAINDERRAIEAELLDVALEQAREIYRGQRMLVLAGHGWHEGVKGIVAGRIASQFGVPVLLFSIDDEGIAHGSGRVVGDINLFKAVERSSELLIRFGGHGAAVGVTLEADKLPELAEQLDQYMSALPEESFRPRIMIDSCVDLAELTLENVERLSLLQPFGQENEEPRLLASNVMLSNCRAVGADRSHLSCCLSDGRHSVSAILFHCPDIVDLMGCTSLVDAAFRVQIDHWRGRHSVKAMLKSLAPASPCAALEACLDSGTRHFLGQLFERVASSHEPDGGVIQALSSTVRPPVSAPARARWESYAHSDPAKMRRLIVRALIGDKELRPTQTAVLDALAKGRSSLAIMATGRGKSLLFQVHAALIALQSRKVSVFVYPLRALIADQAYHLQRSLSPLGITCQMLTGASCAAQRREVAEELAQGRCDIILTTPEYLICHEKFFRSLNSLGFLVIDEAHHLARSKAGYREAYRQLGEVRRHLGNPTVLATTATADAAIVDEIVSQMGIEELFSDATGRDNLTLDDQRNSRKRDSYLAKLVAKGEKTIIYVNSRDESLRLARNLRRQVPQIASFIGFYNAGLTRIERQHVEELFRDDKLSVLVATSAFGEGVNIPNIRHVVLYHLPFNAVECNQMCGRIGRDGRQATIHLLFGKADKAINDRILFEQAPAREIMAQIYCSLRSLQRSSAARVVNASLAEIASVASGMRGLGAVTARSADSGVEVFRELGLIEFVEGGEGGSRSIRVVPTSQKVELSNSVRYREGLEEIASFEDFYQWVMTTDAQSLVTMLTHPILPDSSR